MRYLIPLLLVASTAHGHDIFKPLEPLKCEQRLGGDLVRTITRMRTLRTVSSHFEGVPTAALRTVLDEYLAGDFPEDVETHNDSPLPIFEIKAERKLEQEGSKHKLMVLKASKDALPAAIVHEEQFGDEPPVFMTMPLGEASIREIREALLQAYQIDDRLSPRMADMNHLALFADDRLRIDPRQRGGLSETAYADVLEIVIRGHQHDDQWRLNLRRESDRGAVVRVFVNETEKLVVFKKRKYNRARARAMRKVTERLEESTSNEESIEVFIGEGSDHPEMEIYRVLGERNVPRRALRLPDDQLSEELIRLEFGSLENEFVEHVEEENQSWFEIRASMPMLRKLLLNRIGQRI